MLQDNIVLYRDFEIIEQLEFCSFVKYITIYNEVKNGILLNRLKKIVLNIPEYSSRSFNDVLEKQNQLYGTLKDGKVIQLKGEYKLSNYEYIVDFPYSATIRMNEKNNLRDSFRINRFSDKLIQDIQGISNRKDLMKHAKKEVQMTGNLVFYDYKKITKLLFELKLIKNKSNNKNHSFIKIDDHSFQTRTNVISNNNFKNSTKNFKENLDIDNISTIILPDKELKVESKSVLKAELKVESKKNNFSMPHNNFMNKDKRIKFKGSLEPRKKQRSFIAINRNMTIVKYLKNLYKNQCQICGEAIEISKNMFISQVHHIKPLGTHNGADVIGNMIVLCPNHHAMFDRGAITIDIDKRIVLHCNSDNHLNNKQIYLKHEINRSYLEYYNKNIFNNPIKSSEYKQYTTGWIATLKMDSNIQFVDYGNIVTLKDIDTMESFNIRIENKFNKDFMKPLEKVILGKTLNEIFYYQGFQYSITKILKQ